MLDVLLAHSFPRLLCLLVCLFVHTLKLIAHITVPIKSRCDFIGCGRKSAEPMSARDGSVVE